MNSGNEGVRRGKEKITLGREKIRERMKRKSCEERKLKKEERDGLKIRGRGNGGKKGWEEM